MMTIDAAFNVFQEDYIGTLESGKFADLIFLSDSPLDVQADELKDLEVLTTIQGFLEPDTWTVFETNVTVIIPGVVALIFGILVVVGGLLVAVGSSKGNYFAIILGLIIIILWHFVLPPSAPLTYDTYVKATAAPFLYLVGGLFGLSIAEE